MSLPLLRQVLFYGVALAVVLVVGARWLARSEPAAPAKGAKPVPLALEKSGGGRVVVHVAGAVRRPGVYRLSAAARVDDAVRRAGGPSDDADLTQVNLAAKLEDGRQVLLPARPDTAAGAAAVAASGSGAAPGVPLNLNTATVDQLDELDGVGPATAEGILEFREANGGFGSVDELGEVPGIGEKRLESLREQVRV